MIFSNGRLSDFFAELDALLKKNKPLIIAIDGNCGSGKTTLANRIAELHDCAVFHTDDFFLRPSQRTPERYAEPGGNFDRERFYEEVLVPIKAGKDVSLRRFSCKEWSLLPPTAIAYRPLCVIEGSYSLHPLLRGSYDYRLALRTDYPSQIRRLNLRAGTDTEEYKQRWIPLETAYFEGTDVYSCADMVIDTSGLF